MMGPRSTRFSGEDIWLMVKLLKLRIIWQASCLLKSNSDGVTPVRVSLRNDALKNPANNMKAETLPLFSAFGLSFCILHTFARTWRERRSPFHECLCPVRGKTLWQRTKNSIYERRKRSLQ